MKKIQYWQFIDMQKRMELRKKYGIKPSGNVVIENNKIAIDGITEGDLEKVSLKELQKASGLKITKENEDEKVEDSSDESPSEAPV